MRLTDRLGDSSLAIFLFHGVVERSDTMVRNYTRKHLEAGVFRSLIAELKGAGTPLSMDQVIGHHRQGDPYPRRAFAITFDDGFENNVSVAAPILEELSVPATFYVSTRFIDANLMSWIDRIEYGLELAGRGRLGLGWTSRSFDLADPAAKIAALEEIRATVKRDPAIEVDDLVDDVLHQCAVPAVSSDDGPLDLKMSWSQVRELAACELFNVGGHSHRHPILSFLDTDALEDEVTTSLELLARHGVGPRHYSYPEGQPHCYSDEVIRVLKEHGVECCPTAVDGVNQVGDDLFHLRRIAVD